jgi:hypothetical protein
MYQLGPTPKTYELNMGGKKTRKSVGEKVSVRRRTLWEERSLRNRFGVRQDQVQESTGFIYFYFRVKRQGIDRLMFLVLIGFFRWTEFTVFSAERVPSFNGVINEMVDPGGIVPKDLLNNSK